MKSKLSIFLFGLLLSQGCATVRPPDVPVCTSLTQRLRVDTQSGHLILTPSPLCMEKIGEPECGYCVYIVSGKELFVGENSKTFLNKKAWSTIQNESVLVPAKESYAPIATYMINSCKKMGCSKEVTRFKVKIDSVVKD